MDGQKTPAPAPTAPPPAPTQGQAPPPAPTIALSVDEFQRYRGLERQFQEFQTARQAELDAKEADRLKAMAEKGEVEKALAEQRKSWEAKHAEAVARHQALESQVFGEHRTATISAALQGREFVGETPEQRAAAAAMVQRLLAEEIEVGRDATTQALIARERGTGIPAQQALAAKLASPSYALFFRATTQGGSGAQGMDAAAPVPQGAKPGSLDAIVADWQKRQGQYGAMGLRPKS